MNVKSLKDLAIEKIIKSGIGWYTVCRKDIHVPSDVRESIQKLLVWKLDYTLRKKLLIQKKVITAQRDLLDGGNVVFINVHDTSKPNSVVFRNRYIEIAGVCYNPRSLTTILISYEISILRCQNTRCGRNISKSLIRIFPESALRCNTCNLAFCEKCVIERNTHGGFDCDSHAEVRV